MNIKEAKEEIIHTVQAYLKKDDTGEYEIPVEHQRPVLLIGPPGIGKTAIMEQVAEECHINLVAYTITHHTRQSAIGLPFISKRTYDGEEYSVTEYTMSEIIASIYDQIERSGIKEGILFLDEINCVSETLAPTMLQFLQYKTFGTHRVPEGFVIVTAGNPPEYNKSVRDFDIVTLDRVKRIFVEEDYSVWKEYASRAGIHGAIRAYLEIRKQNFYSVKADLDGKRFVTARGWEDLSRIITVYEKLGLPVTAQLCVQYLQDKEIAEDFATYYELYNKYRNIYRVPDILEGTFPEDVQTLKEAPFDEKLSLIGLLNDSLNQEFRQYAMDLDIQKNVFEQLKKLGTSLKEQKKDAGSLLTDQIAECRADYEQKKNAHLLNREDAHTTRKSIMALEEVQKDLKIRNSHQPKEDWQYVQQWFGGREKKRQEAIARADRHLTNCFGFFASVYGESQEMVIFLSELSAGYYSLKFVRECGNEAYYKYNKLLLVRDQRQLLQDDVRKIMKL